MYIYKITCLKNNKIYIGQCTKTPQQSQSYFGSGDYLCSAIKKQGKHNFNKEILKDNIPTQTLLDAWEAIFIKKFDSTNKAIGYNILPGTANKFGHCNPSKLPIVRKKIRRALKGKNNPNFGKHRTEEWKKRQSEVMKVKMKGVNVNPVFSEKHKERLKKAWIIRKKREYKQKKQLKKQKRQALNRLRKNVDTKIHTVC